VKSFLGMLIRFLLKLILHWLEGLFALVIGQGLGESEGLFLLLFLFRRLCCFERFLGIRYDGRLV